ncbi:ATP-dependent acyl-CoA ligase [Variovorax sp. WS11]|uniref:AMP-binding protein n=1 Tax=Variovorax sp. WS11 TaxID=1105204 RepID=UPI000D0D22E1|nr:AMP-binding protein [Variovorax sp. WS11]NDZ18896.1 AMP-binding protein [Variovorax sp. WS11]PSL80062.1 ATP-dependent acyl-CoA ligase [Variovorax sp. WS11]
MSDQAFQVLGEPREWTLSRLLRRQAARYGDRRFVRFGDGVELSFAGYDAECDRLARALRAAGLQAGDRVMCMLRNRAEFLLLAIACGRADAVFVPVNTELKGFSLQHQLHNCGARMVVLEADLVAHFNGVAAPPALPSHIVVIGDASIPLPAALGTIGALSFESLCALADDAVALHEPAAHELGCIMYTSGTTGPAKGVLMPHAHLALFSVPSPGLALAEGDTYYVCLPLFHANALFVQVMAALVSGAQVHCVQRFSPNRWLTEIRACGATITNSLGIMTEMLFKSPANGDDADNPLTRMLVVPVADWIADFAKRFGVRVFQGYGMTECNMPVYATEADPCVPGCCGTIRSDLFEVAILDPESDLRMPDGQTGEVCVRPRIANAFMQGYFRMPDKTVEAVRNLWFHTGDAGRIEGGSRLFFADRIKDRIRRRGENVSAFEIEQVLGMLPGVAESAVVGIHVGDAGAEQEIKACIVLVPGAHLTHAQALEHCIANVPRFAVPRFFEFIPELPRTPSNKVQKHLLRATGAGAGCWDREAEGYSARNERSPTSQGAAA